MFIISFFLRLYNSNESFYYFPIEKQIVVSSFKYLFCDDDEVVVDEEDENDDDKEKYTQHTLF